MKISRTIARDEQLLTKWILQASDKELSDGFRWVKLWERDPAGDANRAKLFSVARVVIHIEIIRRKLNLSDAEWQKIQRKVENFCTRKTYYGKTMKEWQESAEEVQKLDAVLTKMVDPLEMVRLISEQIKSNSH